VDTVATAVRETAHRGSTKELDPLLLYALVAAEDHRFTRHSGIDFRAVVRAVAGIVLRKELGGGSTIEQQLVRVITRDSARTIGRKLREMLTACAVEHSFTKSELATAYLELGYFGERAWGVRSAAETAGIDPSNCTSMQAAALVSRLKFPTSVGETANWAARRSVRTSWIERRLSP